MRILVVGTGSIARRHIANLKSLHAEVSVISENVARAETLACELGVAAAKELRTALADVDGVVIANATDRHMDVALAAARAKRAIFIEKPLSHDRTGVDELCALAESAAAPFEIGCTLRNHPAIRALAARLQTGSDGPVLTFVAVAGQRLDQWRPGTDFRASYSAKAARGGGALFDLVHEIDLVQWLAGPMREVSARLDKVGDLDVDAEDLANVTLASENGAVGQVQLDTLSPVARRRLEIVTRDAVFTWSLADGVLLRETAAGVRELASAGTGYQRNTMYVDHMRHFLDRIAGRAREPRCSLAEGVAALDVLLAARQSAQDGARAVRVH